MFKTILKIDDFNKEETHFFMGKYKTGCCTGMLNGIFSAEVIKENSNKMKHLGSLNHKRRVEKS